MGEAYIIFQACLNFIFNLDNLSLAFNMPTIVTDIVNSMFRSQRNRRAFSKKLRAMSTDDSESESDADVSLNDSRASDASLLEHPADLPQGEYFVWGAELSRSRDVHVLKLDEDVNDDEERHLLLLKQVCLGVNAVEGERNVVEIHTTDFSDKEQRHPIASLTLGKREFANLDLCLSWSKTKEIKLKLVMGSGPITLTGNHFIEYLALPEEADDPNYVPDETEAELSTYEVDEDELKDLAKDAEAADGAVNGDANSANRKRVRSPTEQSPTKKQQKVEDNVKVKEVDLKA